MAERDWEEEADRMAAERLAAGDPTGWFEPLYAAGRAGDVAMPWDRDAPSVLLEAWARRAGLHGGRALVVGCALGADAAFVASLGFATTAFDVSPTAVELARARHGDAGVEFVVADLLALPSEWAGAFDLVVEVFTVQALPDDVRPTAIDAVARCVAPGGTLFVDAAARDEDDVVEEGPPWPLTEAEILRFATGDVELTSLERPASDASRWSAVLLRRPANR